MRLIDPVKTAYDRLYRKGVKATREEIRSAFNENEVDTLNADSRDVDTVVDFICSRQSSIISSQSTKIETFKTNEENTLDQESTSRSKSLDHVDSDEIQIPSSSITLSQSQKMQMIQEQSSVLGVQLNNDQIESTALKMISNYDSFEQSIDEVKSLIIQVLNQQHEKAQLKLMSSLNEIAETASNGFNDLSTKAEIGFSAVINQLEKEEQKFRTSTETIKSKLSALIK